MPNLLITILVILIATGSGIYLSRESGLDAKTNGFASVIIGLIGIVALLGVVL
jgi:hypothetical protein